MRVSSDIAEILIYSMKTSSTKFLPQFSFDVGKFRDPIGNKKLTNMFYDGVHIAVRDWVKEDPKIPGLLDQCLLIANDRITHGEVKFLSLAFRDYHGKWISRAVAELVATHLSSAGYSVGVIHEEIK